MISEDVVIEPIISKDKFDRVQKLLETRSYAKINKNGPVYLLTSLLTCGECGRAIIGTCSKSSKKSSVYRAYTCQNHSKRHGSTCSTKNINVKWLDLVVKNQITELINHHFTFNPIRNSFVKEYLEDEKRKIRRLSREITLEEKKLGILVTGYHSTSNELIKKSTENEIEAISILIELSKKNKEELAEKMKSAANKVKDINNGKMKMEDLFSNDLVSRSLVQVFVKEITIDNSEIIMNYRKGDEL